MKAFFIGTRLEACKVFCFLMKNYGYRVPVVTFQNTFIDKNSSDINASKIHILPPPKESALNALYDFLKIHKPQIVLSAGFPYVLPKHFFDSKTIILNSHPHLLPKYRGLKVISETYARGCEEYGVTVHYMSEKVDSGRIILRKKITFLPKGKKGLADLYQLLFAAIEPACIAESLSLLRKESII